MINIPRTMSTQHPDNVRMPFFVDSNVIGGEDEIKETFYTFSHLNSKEQLWDFEGKETDNHVVEKLLSRYPVFFNNHKLGRERFLTLRVPNPEYERSAAKVLIETLEFIPRSYDINKIFYNEDIAPIFEVALPMTTNVESLLRIREYYKQLVVGRDEKVLYTNDMPLKRWIGESNPKDINIIPLFEDKEHMLNSAGITEKYLNWYKKNRNDRSVQEYQRVWLARSDPALNYGSLAATLINKIALSRLEKLEEKSGISIMPILGTGSAPFRGNLKPTNVKNTLNCYPSVQTFTIQSAFKYDYEEKTVANAVDMLENSKRAGATAIDDEEESVLLKIIEKTSNAYRREIPLISDIVNNISKYIPARRRRKQHIGLFGYSRAVKGVKLPRAIGFTAAMYSLGLPPELLGLGELNNTDMQNIMSYFQEFGVECIDSFKYLNKNNLAFFPRDIQKRVLKAEKLVDYEPDRKHQKITSIILNDYNHNDFQSLTENIVRAASIRGFLG